MRRGISAGLLTLLVWAMTASSFALSWVGNTTQYLDGRLMPTRAAFIEKWQTLTVVCQTYPIEPGQRVFAVVTTNRWQTQTEFEFNFDFNVGNNSQWYRILGPFPPGTEVDFYIRAEGTGGPKYDNNGWQNFGFVSRFGPTNRDGAIIQWFQTDYRTIMKRLPEVVKAGYSAIYLPAPQKSGGGGFSAGYNPFDRFDLGDRLQKGTVRTGFGTTQELLELIQVAKRFGIEVYCDLVLNHNDNRASTAIDRYPDMIPEDFHIRSSTDTGNSEIDFNVENSFTFGMLNHDLVGLVDIAHEDGNNTRTGTFTLPSYASFNTWNKPSFIRNPVTPQYYPNNTPLAEDVRQYLRRSCWWLTNVIGFDGFRLDAVKHMPPAFFDSLQGQPGSAVSQDLMGVLYAAKPTAFVFGEDYTSNSYELREFAKTGIQPLDFPLRFKLNDVFNAQGFADLGAALSNGYSIEATTGMPFENGGLGTNVGVAFVQSHDDGPPQANNLAHAFVLTRPGKAKVYYDGNNIEGNDWTHFPKPGRYDALGQGDDYVTRILDARKRFARGSLVNRWVNSNLYIFERQVGGKGVLLVGLNDRGDVGGSMTQQVQTGFAPGQLLQDLTGQQPNVVVGADSRVTITVPANSTAGNSNNARGYVLYAPYSPQALAGIEPVQFADGNGATITQQTYNMPNGTYASAANFKAAVVTGNSISLNIRSDGTGFTAFARLDSGLPMAGRQPLTGTPEGLTDGFVNLDKTAAGIFRLNNIDVSGLADGLHLVKVRVFADTPNRPGIFNEFNAFFYLRRGLPTGWTIDGDLTDFPAPLTTQTRNASSNLNRLDALYVTNDDRFLYVGLAGRVDTAESLTNGFSLWMDMDPGTATGLRDLSKLNDDSGPAARLMSNTRVTLPTTFGAEYGLAVFRHSQLGSSPEDTVIGQPVLPWTIGSQVGLYQVQDAITSVLSPKTVAVAFQPRPNKTDPPKGAEIAIPLRQIYGSGVTNGARIGFIGMLTSTGESGTALAASDANRATLGGRPAPSAWLSNQIVPSQLNINNDWGTNPITLIQSTNYNVKFASIVSGIAIKTRIVPTPRNSDLTTLEVTILNSGSTLIGPLNLIANVPAGVDLLNRTDMTLLAPARPYLRIQGGSLASGSSVTVTLRFRSPAAFKPTFTLMSGEGVL
ncbi:MAG: hypothetical protein K1X67_00380 [Fimbriimonadaceae bacterium]|nr:hypothetical protein [Fimbriimonadaceae bacterium]